MANKFDGDVRPLSNDPLYMGVVFSGSLKRTLTVAHAAPDYGMVHQPGRPAHISRDRWNLLEHLNLARHYTVVQVQVIKARDVAGMRAEYMQRKPPKRAPAPSKPSVFSLEHAVARWPESFKVQP